MRNKNFPNNLAPMMLCGKYMLLVASCFLASCEKQKSSRTEKKESDKTNLSISRAIPVREALKRLYDYGILDDSKQSDEIIEHYNRCRNGDASFEEYPYLSAVFSLALKNGKEVPSSCIESLIVAGADFNDKSEEWMALTYAVDKGNIDLAKLLLKHGADVNIQNKDGLTVLMAVVVDKNKIDLAKLLLEHGADINAKDKNGLTAFMAVVVQGNIDLTKLLLKHGADVNSKDKNGYTALMVAVVKENIDLAKLLLKHGADLNIQDKNGRTALMIAVAKENIDLVKQLLEHSADVNIKDKDGRTALMIAVVTENIDLAKLLLEHSADVNIKDKDGRTALMVAVVKENIDLAKLLLKHGADVNSKDKDGRTAFDSCSNDGIRALLLERGADINAKDKDTALIRAIGNNNSDLAKLLLKRGADINAKDENGDTALMNAVNNNYIDLAKLLLEHNADVNIKDKDRRTALIYAAFRNNIDLAKLLLEHGVDVVNIEDNNGWTALMIAATNNNIDLAKLLIKHGADVNLKNKNGITALMNAVAKENIDLAKLLLKHGADVVNIQDKNGWTSLMHAVDKNNTYLVKLLLEHGVDINAKDKNGQTVLMYAIANNNIDLVKQLLEHIADVNIKDKDGRTALIYAIAKNKIDLVKLLLKHGADLNIQDTDGNTALRFAINRNYDDITEILRRYGADVNTKQSSSVPSETLNHVDSTYYGMGSPNRSGSSFCGTLYDLKQTKSGTDSPYREHTQANCEGVLKEISTFYNSDWPKNYFDKYFTSPTNLYITCFYILHSLDKETPSAYQVLDKVQPSRWVAIYRGTVKAPKSGKFRFVGIGDSVLAVRFNGKNVLACGFHTLEDNVWNGNNRPSYRQGKDFYAYENCDAWNNLFGGFQAGIPFMVEKDQWYQMEVLVSEIGGGAFGFCLLIDDMDNANKPRDQRGTPIFHLFRTNLVEPTSDEAYAQIKYPDGNMRVNPPYNMNSPVWATAGPSEKQISESSSSNNDTKSEEAKNIVLKHINSSSSCDNSVNLQVSCFYNSVDYFDKKNTTLQDIRNDCLQYAEQYPIRTFQSEKISTHKMTEEDMYNIEAHISCTVTDHAGKTRQLNLVTTYHVKIFSDGAKIVYIKSKKK